MSNRYLTLDGTRKISETYHLIPEGFDKVQAEMDGNKSAADAHIANADIHVTAAQKAEWDSKAPGSTQTDLTAHTGNADIHVSAAKKAEWDSKAAGSLQAEVDDHVADSVAHLTKQEHDKLTAIQPGAEVNQPAFAKINDIAAADPSDAVTLKGGVGITVTTKPNSKEVEITATGQAAPGAHGPTHTEHGADPIPTATIKEGGIMSAAQVAALAAHEELLDEHGSAITDLEDRFDTAESEEITLQPGVQMITAKRDARFKLGSIKGKTEINGQGRTGIIGVENPYVIRYGENLLPPFYEWTHSAPRHSVETAPYELMMTITDANEVCVSYIELPVIPDTDYTYSAEHTGYLSVTSSAGEVLVDNTTDQSVMFNSGNRQKIIINVYNNRLAGTFNFKNPMLTIGSRAKLFRPREDSMLALQTELNANPDDGSEPDLLIEREGQYYRFAKWRSLKLTSEVITDTAVGGYTGYKVIRVTLPYTDTANASMYMVKYDGKLLKPDRISDPIAGDSFNIGNNTGYIWIGILNADSGWGDGYTPTPDEIKAYFLGWRMGRSDTWGLYDGTDGLKAWGKIDSAGNLVSGTGTIALPTVMSDAGYTPYNLLYKLATPVVEPIVSEGCLTLAEGENQIEVGTGIVLRESTKPALSAVYGSYEINSMSGNPSSVSPNQLSSKASKILDIYRDSRRDTARWIKQRDINAYGSERAFAWVRDFDPAAAYSVTYIKLDKSLAVPIDGALATNEKTILSDLTRGVQEAISRVSVVEQKKAEKDSPVWITPTLLNGWADLGGADAPTGYYKDSLGIVHVRGMIKDGATSPETVVFVLPPGYRPAYYQSFVGISSGIVLVRIQVRPDGRVVILEGANNVYLSFDLSFLAGR